MTAAEVREVLEVLGESFGTTADGLIAEIVRASITRDVVWLAVGAIVLATIALLAVRWFVNKNGWERLSEYEGPALIAGAITCAFAIGWVATFIDLIRWLISPRGEAILFVINNMGG